jgi:hypothetical protein
LKNGQKLKLVDAHVTPRNIQEVLASKLGDAPEAPLLHRQKSGHLSSHYFYCFMHYAFFLEHQCFYFSVLFSFVCCNKWMDLKKFLLEKLPSFSFTKNTQFFILTISMSVLFF